MINVEDQEVVGRSGEERDFSTSFPRQLACIQFELQLKRNIKVTRKTLNAGFTVLLKFLLGSVHTVLFPKNLSIGNLGASLSKPHMSQEAHASTRLSATGFHICNFPVLAEQTDTC